MFGCVPLWLCEDITANCYMYCYFCNIFPPWSSQMTIILITNAMYHIRYTNGEYEFKRKKTHGLITAKHRLHQPTGKTPHYTGGKYMFGRVPLWLCEDITANCYMYCYFRNIHVNSGVRDGSPPRRRGMWFMLIAESGRVHLHGVVTRDVQLSFIQQAKPSLQYMAVCTKSTRLL